MIYLGSMMFFRREKYRLVLVNCKILAFKLSTMIAVLESVRICQTYTKYGDFDKAGRAVIQIR